MSRRRRGRWRYGHIGAQPAAASEHRCPVCLQAEGEFHRLWCGNQNALARSAVVVRPAEPQHLRHYLVQPPLTE